MNAVCRLTLLRYARLGSLQRRLLDIVITTVFFFYTVTRKLKMHKEKVCEVKSLDTLYFMCLLTVNFSTEDLFIIHQVLSIKFLIEKI